MYAERQVALQRLQDILEVEREQLESLTEKDLQRLENEGMLLTRYVDNEALIRLVRPRAWVQRS